MKTYAEIKRMQSERTFLLSDIAELFGVSERWVQKLEKMGMPKVGRGQYDLEACRWYIKYLREQANENSNDTIQQAKIKFYQAKAKKTALDVSRYQGQMLDANEVKMEVMAIVSELKTSLQGLASRFANLVPALKTQHELKAFFDAEFITVLNQMASNLEKYSSDSLLNVKLADNARPDVGDSDVNSISGGDSTH